MKIIQFIDNLVIIFGFGKFGRYAFDAMKFRYNCLILDLEPDKTLKDINPKIEFFNSTENLLKEIRDNQPIKDSRKYFALKGSIHELSEILKEIIPKYLIPTAPVHVMAETIKEMYSQYLTEPNSVEPEFGSFLAAAFSHSPVNLNIVNHEAKSIYYSYADKDQICPDSCAGPLDYCPNFNKEKPIAVSEFVKQIFGSLGDNELRESKYAAVCFESSQIIPGLGGIEHSEIIKGLQLTKDLIGQNRSLKKIIISTTCNCHGVSTIYERK